MTLTRTPPAVRIETRRAKAQDSRASAHGTRPPPSRENHGPRPLREVNGTGASITSAGLSTSPMTVARASMKLSRSELLNYLLQWLQLALRMLMASVKNEGLWQDGGTKQFACALWHSSWSQCL